MKMKKIEFKKQLKDLMLQEIEELNWEEKLEYIRQILVEINKEYAKYDQSKKGKPWSDNELRLVLRTAPTKENIILLAKAFHRGYGSIEQIFRWAAEDQRVINEKRPDDKFIKQIKKIAKEVGWRAT